MPAQMMESRKPINPPTVTHRQTHHPTHPPTPPNRAGQPFGQAGCFPSNCRLAVGEGQTLFQVGCHANAHGRFNGRGRQLNDRARTKSASTRTRTPAPRCACWPILVGPRLGHKAINGEHHPLADMAASSGLSPGSGGPSLPVRAGLRRQIWTWMPPKGGLFWEKNAKGETKPVQPGPTFLITPDQFAHLAF